MAGIRTEQNTGTAPCKVPDYGYKNRLSKPSTLNLYSTRVGATQESGFWIRVLGRHEGMYSLCFNKRIERRGLREGMIRVETVRFRGQEVETARFRGPELYTESRIP